MAVSSTFPATLTAKLKSRELPVIRQTVAQVVSLLSDQSSEVQGIANIILRDQAFTARVLKIANSAYYRRSHEKVSTISRAIIHIGFASLRDIAITAELADLAQKKLPAGVDLRRLLAKAFVAAHQARAVGQAIGLPGREGLFTSALLESLGNFALATAMPMTYQGVNDLVQFQGMSYSDAHLQVTGMTPHAVTTLVAKVYEFPADLILAEPNWQTCSRWTAVERRAGAVHLAHACAANLFAPHSTEVLVDFTDLMSKSVEAFGLTLARIESLLTEAFQRALELGRDVELDRSCFALSDSADDSARNNFIRICAQLAEPTTV
jgi:HD-like signal output (HDOD) protein